MGRSMGRTLVAEVLVGAFVVLRARASSTRRRSKEASSATSWIRPGRYCPGSP